MKLQHVGVSSIRLFTATRLREMKQPVIICDHSAPIAAMVPYHLYLEWQDELREPCSCSYPERAKNGDCRACGRPIRTAAPRSGRDA